MAITITLVGRTNVGKSTLFNQLTNNRDDALVSNYSSLTRDRKYGYIIIDGKKIILIDTPGIPNSINKDKSSLNKNIFEQTILSVKQADLICLIVNAREKLMYQDIEIANILKKYQKTIFLLVNKVDGLDLNFFKYEFYSLGFKNIYFISATNGIGIKFLLNNVFFSFIPSLNISYGSKKNFDFIYSVMNQKEKYLMSSKEIIKVAIIGKPNVGKSTLINTLLNEKKMVIDCKPGTTRDSIWNFIEYRKKKYVFIDTAGIRKKNKISDNIEKISIYKALQTLKLVNVVLLMINSSDEISDQDLSLFNSVKKYGCSFVVALNKADIISNCKKREIINSRQLKLMRHAKYHFISAKNKLGIKLLFQSINESFYNSIKKVNTSKVTEILKLAIKKHQPPIINRKIRIKMKYAHVGGYNPFTIIIHGNGLEKLPSVYKKYLTNFFQSELKITGSSIFLYFRNSHNPFI